MNEMKFKIAHYTQWKREQKATRLCIFLTGILLKKNNWVTFSVAKSFNEKEVKVNSCC